MARLLDPLSDAYLLEIAQHFASLDLPYSAPRASDVPAALLERGRILASQGDEAAKVPACVQCHSTALTGVVPNTPGLLGLSRDYLNAPLGAWKTRQRRAHAPDCMADVERKALWARSRAEREAWLEAVTNDPLLPSRILPSDYLGQQAWRRRVEV